MDVVHTGHGLGELRISGETVGCAVALLFEGEQVRLNPRDPWTRTVAANAAVQSGVSLRLVLAAIGEARLLALIGRAT